jgi:4-amino-4-deoxy-L-arabinose transferase-like glycosyltransferase
LIYAIILPIAPQEAYYWNYSRHPALSYFDHPPMAAYLIKFTTSIGLSNFSIHLAAVILSVLMSFAVYRLGSLLFDKKVGFWSVVAINLTFIYALGGMIITPDGPMLLFWVMSMIACFRIDRNGGGIWWILLGIFLGAGFASKYTMVFAAFGAFLFFISSLKRMKWFATIWPYVAIMTVFIVALPVLYWNYQNNWASFLFQTQRRAGEMTEFRPDFFFGFVGTMIVIYGILPIPLLYAGMWNSIKRAFRERLSGHALLVWFSVPLVILLLPVAARSWVKMNWTAPAFIGWYLAGAGYYFGVSKTRKWVRLWGKTSIIFLALSFMLAHIVILLPGFYIGKGDYFSGWGPLAARIDEIRADMPEPCFICGYEYKTASMLAFYLKDHPETLSNNVIDKSGLQYDYWSNPDALVGYNAIFVYDERVGYKNPERLNRFFDSVSPEEIVTVKKGGKIITGFHIFRCYGYYGPGGLTE